MPILTTPLVNFLVILAIGLITGLVFNRYGRSWLGRTMAGTGAGEFTYALIGIAGAFIGFHIGVIAGLLPSPMMYFLTAIVGAILTIWLWRGR